MNAIDGTRVLRDRFPDVPILALTVYQKLQVHSKTEAVAKALRERLV